MITKTRLNWRREIPADYAMFGDFLKKMGVKKAE